jgi:transcriptional regulator with XRE-family HTH domain
MNELTIPEDIKTLGGAVRWARHQRGLTMRALAERIGKSAGLMSLLESGDTRTNVLGKLAAELGVQLEQFTKRPQGPTSEMPRSYSTERAPGRFCSACVGLAHRWPRIGRCRCGECYAPEPEAHALPDQRSHAGYVSDQGLPPTECDPKHARRKRPPKAA